MEVVGCVLLAGGVGLVCPVDSDLLLIGQFPSGMAGLGNAYGLMNTSSVQGLHGAFSGTRVIVLNEAIVVALCLWRKVSKSSNKDQGEAEGFSRADAKLIGASGISAHSVYTDQIRTFLSGIILTF